MPASPPPSFPASPAPPRRRGRPPKPKAPRPDPVAQAVEVLAALAKLPPTPDLATLAMALGRLSVELDRVLASMERAGLVERWREGPLIRVMLSVRSLARLGLNLSSRGDRWNPDRACPSARSLRG